MRLGVIFFAAGVWWLQQQSELPALNGAWMLAVAALAAAMLRGSRLVEWARLVLLNALCFGLGFYWAAALAQARLADALPAEWEGRDVEIVGVVAGLPQVYDRNTRFEFDVEQVLTPAAPVPRRISLSWWGAPERDGRAATVPPLRPGERWRLTVRLRRPHGSVNPGGFDYEAWLFERGIRAVGYVRSKGINQRLAPRVHRPSYWVQVARDAVRERIERVLAHEPYRGVIVALAIGEQRAIPAEQWQTFTRTGVNHLMSISGLHVTMVSGLAFFLAQAMWRRSAWLTLRLPARKAAALVGVAAAFAYTLLAGFAVPAQRTLYMLAVAAAVLWSGLRCPVSAVLSAALLGVLVVDPWAVLAPGFWLSFGAVALILYVTAGRMGEPHWLVNWARVQWAVTVGLVPPLIAMFQQVSLVSPAANAAAIPVVSLGVVPLTLAGAALPFDFVLKLAHQLTAGCMVFLEWLSEMPASVWQQHAPRPWAVLAALAGSAWLLLPRGVPARWLGIAGFLPLFLSAPPPLAEGELRLTVLDVGHGVAVVVQTRSHALLYDTGPAFGDGADSGSRIVVPYLRASGVRRLDGLIVSHDDIDHSGGAASVLQAMPVDWLLSSLHDMDPLPLQAERAFRCYAGQSWEWDGVRFDVLHPPRESYEDRRVRDNDLSCVMKVSARFGQVLLPGDIESRGEAELLASYGGRLRADVLIAPHQGSKTSSSSAFIREVDPQAVVFPVGYRNRFRHPHDEVVARYRALGSQIFRTDRDGALLIETRAGSGFTVTPTRAQYRRYWHTPISGERTADRLGFPRRE
jgi:competence protein ComEC